MFTTRQIDEVARDLADRYTKTNLDNQSQEYQQAFRFFQSRQLEDALKVLQSIELEKTSNVLIQEQERTRSLSKEYIERDSLKNIKKKQVTEGLSFKAQLHISFINLYFSPI